MANSDTHSRRSARDAGHLGRRPSGGHDAEDHGAASSTRATTPVARMVNQTVVEVVADHQRDPAPSAREPSLPTDRSGPGIAGGTSASVLRVAAVDDRPVRAPPGAPTRPGHPDRRSASSSPDHGGGAEVGLARTGRWWRPASRPPGRPHRSTGPRCDGRAAGLNHHAVGQSCPRLAQTTTGDGDHLIDVAGGGRTGRGETHGRACPGGGTGHGNVTTQVHQHTTPERGGDAGRRRVGGPRLGRGTQVDVDSHRDGHGPCVMVQLDPPPSRGRLGSEVGCPPVGPEFIEVPVVAELDQCRPDGGINDAQGSSPPPSRPRRWPRTTGGSRVADVLPPPLRGGAAPSRAGIDCRLRRGLGGPRSERASASSAHPVSVTATLAMVPMARRDRTATPVSSPLVWSGPACPGNTRHVWPETVTGDEQAVPRRRGGRCGGGRRGGRRGRGRGRSLPSNRTQRRARSWSALLWWGSGRGRCTRCGRGGRIGPGRRGAESRPRPPERRDRRRRRPRLRRWRRWPASPARWPDHGPGPHTRPRSRSFEAGPATMVLSFRVGERARVQSRSTCVVVLIGQL